MSSTGPLVYVVDDDDFARNGVASLIRSAGLTTKTFTSGEEFLAFPRPKTPSCLVLDVNLPGLSGLDVQQELAKSGVQVPIIFLTGHGDIPMTVRALKSGAANFLTKPFEDEELLNAVRQCLASDVETDAAAFIQAETGTGQELVTLHKNREHAPIPPAELHLEDLACTCDFEGIVGGSTALRKVLDDIEIVAPMDATILIQGETGTGKELIAHAIHARSKRRAGPFVTMNCAAIPRELLESEIFGHEKGAFTGAVTRKIGRFEAAHQGTLFLDEIGDMPLELQAKVLRILQEQEFERLGSTVTQRVSVRVVAATNRDLDRLVSEKQFRSDLYYRISVFPIRVPPLRERRDDIPSLVAYFVKTCSECMNKQIETISSTAVDALLNYDWPGNIRELQNFVERSVILTPGRVLTPPISELLNRRHVARPVTLKECEREHILKAVQESNWVIAGPHGAAARLGLPRSTLMYRIRKLAIMAERPSPPV